MPRNKIFHSESHEPLRDHKSFELQHELVTGPLSFLNPTRAAYRHNPAYEDSLATANVPYGEKEPKRNDEQLASNINFYWRSRDNRKGRHALAVDPTNDPNAPYLAPKNTSTSREIMRNIVRMATYYPYWDVSWLVATIFTLGSVVWVINAFFAYLPLVQPQTEFKNETLTGGGVTAFIGATIFELGSVLLLIEAVNENRSGCFGWALENVISGGEDGHKIRLRPDKDRCTHHHTNKKNFVGKGSVKEPSKATPNGPSDSTADLEKPTDNNSVGNSWVWFPSWHELKTHYLHELGFLASLAQFIGATIFWISGFTALPGINNTLSQPLLDGIYWAPQIIGGTGFIISGSLYMLETQPKWYMPAWEVLGWHIGFWNLIGALGFTLCGALGPAYGNSGAEYEASLATFWGSWAFLIGSTIQWYESLDKHPVETRGTWHTAS